jgi:hypothetical protein
MDHRSSLEEIEQKALENPVALARLAGIVLKTGNVVAAYKIALQAEW